MIAWGGATGVLGAMLRMTPRTPVAPPQAIICRPSRAQPAFEAFTFCGDGTSPPTILPHPGSVSNPFEKIRNCLPRNSGLAPVIITLSMRAHYGPSAQ